MNIGSGIGRVLNENYNPYELGVQEVRIVYKNL